MGLNDYRQERFSHRPSSRGFRSLLKVYPLNPAPLPAGEGDNAPPRFERPPPPHGILGAASRLRKSRRWQPSFSSAPPPRASPTRSKSDRHKAFQSRHGVRLPSSTRSTTASCRSMPPPSCGRLSIPLSGGTTRVVRFGKARAAIRSWRQLQPFVVTGLRARPLRGSLDACGKPVVTPRGPRLARSTPRPHRLAARPA